MTVMSLASTTVQLLADQVTFLMILDRLCQNFMKQFSMIDKDKVERDFSQLTLEDRDMTMFIVTNLTLIKEKNANMVIMALKLKRKVATELLTTYLATILLLLSPHHLCHHLL